MRVAELEAECATTRAETSRLAGRKSAREAPGGRDARFRLLFEATSDGVWIHTLDGVIREVNDAYCAMSGYSRDELQGMPISTLEAIEDPEEIADHIQKLIAGGGHDRFESKHRRKDGSVFDVDITAIHLGREEGRIAIFTRDITRRKRVEEELQRLLVEVQAQKEKLAALVNSMRDEVWFADAQKRFTLANPAALREFALGPLEAVDVEKLASSLEVLRPDGSPRPIEEAPPLRALAGEVIAGWEELIRTPATGELRWRQVSASPVRDAAGSIIGSVSVVRDITERKRAEADSQAQRLLLETVIDCIPAAVNLIRGSDLTLQLANPAYRAIAPGKDVLGKTLDELWPETRQNFGEICRMVLATGEPYQVDDELNMVRRSPGGPLEPAYFSWSLHRVRLPGEEGWGVLNTAWETTERKRAEEALREREEQLRSLFENLLDGYAYCKMLYDERGRPVDFLYVAVNGAFERLTGLKGVVGKRVTEIFPGIWESQPELLETYGRVASTGRAERFEIHFKPLGLWLYISVYCPKKDHFVAVFDDVTARKTAEADREKLVGAMRDTDRRKNEFMAVLSHELRNPLAPIKNSLFILDHAVPGGDQARRAQVVIARQVDQLARLVDDLLDVTRISRNRIQLQRQRLELNELMRRTMEDHRSLFDEAGVFLELEPAPKPVFVVADWNRLVQVVGNLLQNAAKFTPRGGRVKVMPSVDLDGKRATLRVADTGIGMTQAMLGRLFEPFTQADTTLDRSKGGLGLGLALVKGLVQLHGGEVSVASAGLGQGTEFAIRLPLDELAASGSTEDPAPVAAALRRRILVIEDNVDAADSLREALEFRDHEIVVAYDGQEGIAKAREFRPDVVLCDIGLPGMDGYEVARAFHADETLKGTFLVALSGYALPDDVQRAAQAGFDRHLAKPPSLEKLEEVLGTLGTRR